MKLSKEKVEEIAGYIEKLAERKWDVLNSVVTERDYWELWHYIHREITHEDDSPRFNQRKRFFHHDRNFSLYPDDTNDTTMLTGLKAAYKLAVKHIKAKRQ